MSEHYSSANPHYRPYCTILCPRREVPNAVCHVCNSQDKNNQLWDWLWLGPIWRTCWSKSIWLFRKLPSIEYVTSERPILLAFLVAMTMLIIICLMSFTFWKKEFLEGVMVESWGMVFDLFIIGWFVLWLNHIGEKRRMIKRYKEEIDDFLGWKSDKAMYRIVGNIRRLNRYGVSSIILWDAFLSKANLMLADLSGAHLLLADLIGADLSGANLIGANLYKANLSGANLDGANLSRVNLSGANLLLANLSNIRWDKNTVWPENFEPPPSL